MIVNDQESTMKSKMEVANEWAAAVAPGCDIDAAEKLLSDDFQNLDQDGKVALTKDGILNLGRMMHVAFTDYGFVTTRLSQEGDYVIITGHNEGIHTADLDLSAMEIGMLPASGKKIVWLEASAKLTIVGDRIKRLEPHAGPAGLKAFLLALGIEFPPE
jgi:SnoaL-like polyketide cyclase